jgi:NTE family protein
MGFIRTRLHASILDVFDEFGVWIVNPCGKRQPGAAEKRGGGSVACSARDRATIMSSGGMGPKSHCQSIRRFAILKRPERTQAALRMAIHSRTLGSAIFWIPSLLAAIILAPAVRADEPERPRICLVLSGGGARGAAHVGVLKVLEEYRVPVDCVVGTSMGSLVGAAYATGMTLPEMDEVINSISTELLFKEKPPRQELAMRRKEDDNSILFTPEVGISEGKLKAGKGLVSGVQLETVLRRLSKAQGYFKFDDLPIPYRAVATNLVTGKAVVFSEGELAQVMRASMSVPGAVAPATYNDMLLVDGMLTSNLPVQSARAMGADIIIAVNVGTPLLKREQITGILGISEQMLSILTEQNVQASIATLTERDILIDASDLGNFTTGDFDSLPEIAPLGEAAARRVSSRLQALAIPADRYAALRARQRAIAVPENPPIDEIRFVNLKRVNPIAPLAVMDTEVDKPVDQKVLDADIRRIYGTGDFEHVNYRFLEEPGRRVLAVEAVEKAWGPDYLRFGLGLSSDFTGDAYFNLLASYRQTWLNSLGAEWRNDIQFGRTSRLLTEFYQPLDARNYFFVAPNASFERRSTDLYQDDDHIATYDMRSSQLGIDVGSQLNRYGELRLGVTHGLLRPSLDTGPEALSPGESSIQQGAYVFRLIFDQLDNASFPRSGWRGGLHIYDSSESLGAEHPYTKWDADASGVFSFGNHTFNLAAKVGDRIGSDRLPRYDQFQWGGFLQMSGYATGQLAGQSLQFGRIMYYHRIMKGTLLDGAYGGFSLEAGRVEEPLVPGNSDDWSESASLFVGMDTPIGPAYFGYGRAEDGNDAFYFYLGKPY